MQYAHPDNQRRAAVLAREGIGRRLEDANYDAPFSKHACSERVLNAQAVSASILKARNGIKELFHNKVSVNIERIPYQKREVKKLVRFAIDDMHHDTLNEYIARWSTRDDLFVRNLVKEVL